MGAGFLLSIKRSLERYACYVDMIYIELRLLNLPLQPRDNNLLKR